MLRQKWEAASATILSAQSEPGAANVHHYQIEVRKQSGEVSTSQVSEQGQVVRAVGSKLQVEIHSKSGEIRLGNSRADAIRGVVNMAQMIRDAGTAGSAGAAGGLAAGVAGLAGMLANQQGGGPVQVTGPGGQNIPMNLDPGEMRSLTHALIAGSPAEKQAARQRLQEIKAQAQQQGASQQGGFGPLQGGMGQQQGGSLQGAPGPQQGQGGFGGQQAAAGGFSGSGPSSFDDVGTPRHPASPGAGSAGGLSQQGGGFGAAGSFGAAPSSFGSGPSSFGSFDPGTGQGSREERIAKLQQLLNKGILTESEFEAQRQQIINGG